MKKSIFKNKLSSKYGFTLVELIIVITILTILSTIGYISYNSYISQSRDSNRVAQVSGIVSAIETYRIKGGLPIPEDKVTIYNSGEIIGYQGYAGEDTLDTIGFEDGGKDPKDNNYYTYFVNSKQRKLGILTFLENGVSEKLDKIPVSYGDKVGIILDKDYGPIQDNTALFTTGVDIKTTTDSYNVYFSDKENISGTGDLLQVLYGTATTGIIGEDCTDYIDENAGYFLDSGYYLVSSDGTLEKTYCDMTYGYCRGILPENAEPNVATEDAGIWSYNETAGNCTFVCATNYTWNGITSNCDIDKYTITFDGNGVAGTMSNQIIEVNATTNLISNTFVNPGYTFVGWATTELGTAEYTNGESYTMGTSNVTLYAQWLCGIDYYESAGECIPVGNGYYSPDLDNIRYSCDNHPDNASRDYTYTSDGNGTNSCSATYTPLCGTDLYESVEGTCSAVGNGYYSPNLDNSRPLCTNKPDNASRDYTYTSDGNGTNSCSATYTPLCGTDLYESVEGTCAAVGIGNYSPNLNNTITACSNYLDNASRDYTYTSDGNGTNSCTATYTPKCITDYYESVEGTCTAVGIGNYSPNLNNIKTACSNYPDNASRDYTYTSDGNGTNSCTATYTPKCITDYYESVEGTCTAVGVGYYSPNLNNTRPACTNKPANSYYTTDGNGINNCGFACNSGLIRYGGSCQIAYPGCNTPDIYAYGYYIAACNVGATTLRASGNYYTWNQAQTACAAGYHVPHYRDWVPILGGLEGAVTSTTLTPALELIKMPWAGWYQPAYWSGLRYWSAELDGSRGRQLNIRQRNVAPANSAPTTYLNPVRCIRN